MSEEAGYHSRDAVILEVEGTPLRCNRRELSKYSDYFKVMFEGNFVESTQKVIKLESVCLKAMNIILRLLWDERYFIENEDLLPVLQASCMLQFVEIKNMCVKKITDNLSPANCFNIWQICEVLDLRDLCLKAKSMALLEFTEIKDCECLMQLNLRQLYIYLANRNLQCDSEMSVFQTCMKWWYENSDDYAESVEENLLILLACIDFNAVSISDVREMQSYPDISANSYIISVLTCAADIKANAVLRYEEGVINKARNLLETKPRVFQQYLCFWGEPENSVTHFKRKLGARDVLVIYHDFNVGALKGLLKIGPEKWSSLDGFKILGYKEFVFLFGGEFLIGKGDWNTNFWVYDSVRGKWERKCVMPYKRRHFQSCVCGNHLYVIGGTGEFRVLQENMFWYNYKYDEWGPRITLPFPEYRQIKCCEYKKQLFVLNMNKMCGYVFEHDTSNWLKFNICDTENVVPGFSETCSLFSYKDSIFIKSNCNLIELKMAKFELVVINNTKFTEINCDYMESVLCNNILYSLYKLNYEDESGEGSYYTTLEKMCMETHERTFIFENLNSHDLLKIGEEKCTLYMPFKLFSYHYYDIVENDEFISSYLLYND